MRAVFWLLSIVGALFGAITLVESFTADSAPKQAAAAAMAVGLTVIPYCLARAISALTTDPMLAELTKLNQQVAALKTPLAVPEHHEAQGA